ncbi:cell cycle checkpoint protein RAD17-like [Patiria miniata]|uniref:Checkpoint protein RAD24-like helical bundle domain-containing protein n=1 Tax=Patiria miniata TaxID=46514 RepID=A0A914AXL9_PATMI|nr:cell cycle checkpoint protein RAD17-like [Patiria miniata]
MSSKSLHSSQKQQWVSPSFDDFEFDVPSQSSQRTKQSTLKTAYGKNTLPQFLSRKRNRNEDDSERNRTVDRRKQRQAVEADIWVDKHTPQIQSELAVHKKKIAEVEDWLRLHAKQRRHAGQTRAPILLLTGPAGTGKTATVQVLAKQLQMEVQEWSNPDTAAYDPDRPMQDRQDFNVIGGPISQSQTALFQDFLTRANRYPTLELFGGQTSTQKLCLVEEIPNAFYRDPQTFHNILRKFTTTGRSPLVFIISDSYGGESSAFKLFPKNVQGSLGIDNISFNPVAITSMVKVMTRIATTESSQGKRRFAVPSKATIEALANASAGDIRSAVNSLQFACLKDTHDLDKALVRNPSKPSKGKHAGKQMGDKSGRQKREKASVEDSTLCAIGGRDTSMFLFRALGKILYCKREPKTQTDPVLPPHLSHHDRDRLKIHPEDVLEHTHMSSENFNLYLHQNYLDFYEHLDDVVEASHYFSDSDLLTCEWRSRSSMTTYGASLTSRGVIHCNTARSRCNSTSGGGWKPLHKPQWFEINRKYNESCAGAKGLFVGHCWTPVELQTQLLPYLAVISVPLENPGQINFLQEITRFTSNPFGRRRRLEKLEEKDNVSEDEDEDIVSSQGVKLAPQRRPHITPEHTDPLMTQSKPEDNEIIIEEFDD